MCLPVCPLLGVLAAVLYNSCRDQATNALGSKLDAVFGPSVHIGGLGGVLTCGVMGLRAGISHAASPMVRLLRIDARV